MKKISLHLLLALLLVVGLSTQSCKKEIDKNITMSGGTVYFHTEAHPHDGNTLTLLDTMLNSELSHLLEDNGISLDKVKSVKLKSAKLNIIDPSLSNGITFDPYDFANAHIQAGSKAQEQLAYITTIPHTGLTEISLEPQAQELVDFLKEDQVNIQLRAYNSADVLPTDYRLEISYDVLYTVKE